MSAPVGYAVIDTETTGIHPGYHHRIAEIAIVHLEFDGQITDEWATLINPERDLGPQAIHGIRAADARRAPKFHQVKGEVVRRLRGRLPVAHNWPFDARHLKAEFDRLRIETPFDPSAGLCTMAMASRILPRSGRSLIDCCRRAGIQNTEWHAALADARAAAMLLWHMISKAGSHPKWTEGHLSAIHWPWREYDVEAFDLCHRSPRDVVAPHFLARIVDRIPRTGLPVADAYLAMLDAALLDRNICDTEADALVELAYEIGLTRAEVVGAHFGYLRAIARAAWSDGVITDQERQNLNDVAILLGLGTDSVEELLQLEAATAGGSGNEQVPAVTAHGLVLREGLVVVLTGDMSVRREVWWARAEAVGLVPQRNVTRRTDLCVAADPDSMSGKAKQARLYGVPVVTEEAFANALLSLSDGS